MPSSSTQTVRLLIADRRPIAADGLATECEEDGDMVVEARCHAAGDLSAVLGPRSGIDAVVIDAEMFDDDASRAVQAVRCLDPGVAVLVLTTRVDEDLLAALAHEHVSCVSAYSEAQRIVSALRSLLSGQTLLPAEVQRALTDRLRQPQPAARPPLTMREEQVLELAATGLTISQIGASLYISHSTAKTHLLRIYDKLDAPNRSAAIATAVARGLLHVGSEAA